MNKKLSILLLFLMCFSTISSASASNLSNHYNGDNYYTDSQTDEDPDVNDVADYDSFTPASKSVFNAITILNIPIMNITPNLHTFEDIVAFFKSKGVDSTACQVDKNELRIGDIVQIKNSDYSFLVYCGEDADGNIILEDVYNRFKCSPQSFDLLFTGNAILIDHTVTKMTEINAALVTDATIHDPNIVIGPMVTGFSTYQSGKSSWANAQNNPRIKAIAKSLGGTSGTQSHRIKQVWNWMHGGDGIDRHIWYDNKNYHENTKYSIDKVLDGHYANCCEQSRLVVAIARAMGLTARYVHIPGHVFTQIKDTNGHWFAVDTCESWGYGRSIPSGATYLTDLNY